MDDVVQVILPPVADETEVLDFSLTALTEAIHKINPDKLSHGFLGGQFGYGAHWENDVFMMRPYCWCEKIDCLWCTVWLSNETDCTEEEAEAHRDKQTAEIAARFGANSYRDYGRAPNFWHKRTGLKVNWYKWIGRDMEVENSGGADIASVFRECMASLIPQQGPDIPEREQGASGL